MLYSAGVLGTFFKGALGKCSERWPQGFFFFFLNKHLPSNLICERYKLFILEVTYLQNLKYFEWA